MERSSIGGRRPRAYREEMDEVNVNIEDEEEEEEEENEDTIGGSGESSRRRVRLPSRRGPAAGTAPCQAENCHADLSNAKRYYQRHKVCEVHANAPIVLVSGSHQRFCQQCSRFHELAEFDENKKSCRRRLAGHNERRRKSSN